jgi:hypothetical protein
MKRTNIYLDEEHLLLLKHIAVEEQLSFTEVVRRALQQYLDSYRRDSEEDLSLDIWNRRMENLLARVRERTGEYSPAEIESDITAASEDSRRRRTNAARRR